MVLGELMRNLDDAPLRRARNVRISGHRLVFGDDDAAFSRRAAGVIDEEATVRLVVRMERDAQQSLLVATVLDAVFDVEKGRREELAILNDADAAFLLDCEETVRAVGRICHLHGALEVEHDEIELDRCTGRAARDVVSRRESRGGHSGSH